VDPVPHPLLLRKSKYKRFGFLKKNIWYLLKFLLDAWIRVQIHLFTLDSSLASVIKLLHSLVQILTASVVQWSQFLAAERRCIVFPVWYELNLYMLCRRK
jgi:hypothetical protein